MKTFEWRNFMGHAQTLAGVDSVEFGTAHVVFFDAEGRVLLGEQVRQINELKEVIEKEEADADS